MLNDCLVEILGGGNLMGENIPKRHVVVLAGPDSRFSLMSPTA